ncbi:OLC1v1000177C1 [Oldenlandia corymbosa var. corymbosa]|uniref:OLC1v1000177C1 n=1 Tax=Oldenlandia corymbosa var. corymbosa TaxID=529605 RepID=A0AAV1D327_OLDCO|nr:OLC1v1000177C1 [Oldenlandia corymbosa var. corymbosa]
MKKGDKVHVVLVPWSLVSIWPFDAIFPAHNCFGQLRSSCFTCFHSKKTSKRLPTIPPEIQTSFDLVAIPLPTMDSNLLPDGAEATIDIPFEKIQYLNVATDLLKNPFKNFIADKSPDWIISDIRTCWAAETVYFGRPEYLTGEGQKAARPSVESLMTKPPWVKFESKVAYRKHEAARVHRGFYSADVSGLSTAQRIAKVVQASKAVAIRSCLEFEPEYFRLQERISGKPAISVGFLPPGIGKPTLANTSDFQDDAWNNIFEWLDQQKPRSVKPSWANTDDPSDTDALPSDFRSRVAGKGVVKIGWAPQREILGHPSIGGTNSRYLVEKGLAVEVDRNEDGSFTKVAIADSLRRAMAIEGGGEAAALRARAGDAAAIFGDEKLNDGCIEAFVRYMKMNGTRKECHLTR